MVNQGVQLTKEGRADALKDLKESDNEISSEAVLGELLEEK